MQDKLLASQFNYRKDPSKYAGFEHAIIILKPNYSSKHVEHLTKFVNDNNLEISYQTKYQFNRDAVLVIYNDIFRFNDNDILFGTDWKTRKLLYMISSISGVYVIRGENAQSLCETFKYLLREQYGKLSIPDKKLGGDEFEKLAIKNIIHVVDTDETELAIQLLVSDQE
ncbi:hypothetical protein COU91_02935 [Candidatus Saccharibacteria bacterium CG10_big_fil_rev_8_21_14_0_10_47_8]|nr:MAG: hypothetical protein COU91_02935 [Candidatus Saccharibacteria bacterium CG10_big_fil_rev_8_21_14_0_10_47_8]